MHVCGSLLHVRAAALLLSGALLSVVFPLCHAQTAQSHHQSVHDRLNQDVVHLLNHRLENVEVLQQVQEI